MTAEQLVELDQAGFDIQPHSWNHHRVTRYTTEADSHDQVVALKQTLEALLGHATPYFAYPYGIYDAASAAKISAHGYRATFRPREVMDEDTDPLLAIPRSIVNPYWTMAQFELALAGE